MEQQQEPATVLQALEARLEQMWPQGQAAGRWGRFQLLRELGRGGNGIVFLAFDPLPGRQVALKIPRWTPELDREAHERFLQEAKAAGQIDHPNVLPVYEAGQVGPVWYLAMPYCPGPTLAAWLKERTEPVPVREAAELVRVLAQAMQAVHGRGIWHRDLKPSNVLLVSGGAVKAKAVGTATEPAPANGHSPLTTHHSTTHLPLTSYQPKISDFGLAKLQEADRTATRTGAALGTPAYMAPEQAMGSPADVGPATDVYGLGAILYELLTGRPPFRGEHGVATLHDVVHAEPAPPRRLRREVPVDLDTICLKSLAKRPKDRYASAGELAEELQRYLDGQPIRARPLGWVQRVVRWARRHPGKAALLGGAAALALTLAAMLSWMEARERHNQIVLDEAQKETDLHKAKHDEQQWLAQNLSYAADMPRGHEMLEANQHKALRRLLKRHEPTAGAKDVRSFAWHYLERRTEHHPIGPRHFDTLISGPPASEAWCAVFLPDGRTLAVGYDHEKGNDEETLKLWDMDSREASVLSGHLGAVLGMAVNPDGTRLASASYDSTVRLWDSGSGGMLREFRTHAAPVRAVAFSPDGKTLASAGSDSSLVLSSLADGFSRSIHEAHGETIRTLAFSHDGRFLLSGGNDKMIRVWNASDLSLVHTLQDAHNVQSIACSPTDALVASGNEVNQVKLWDTTTGKLVATLEAHTGKVRAVAFAPDGKSLASGGEDKMVRLWNVPTGREMLAFDTAHFVNGLTFNRPGKTLAAALHDGTVRIWSAE